MVCLISRASNARESKYAIEIQTAMCAPNKKEIGDPASSRECVNVLNSGNVDMNRRHEGETMRIARGRW